MKYKDLVKEVREGPKLLVSLTFFCHFWGFWPLRRKFWITFGLKKAFQGHNFLAFFAHKSPLDFFDAFLHSFLRKAQNAKKEEVAFDTQNTHYREGRHLRRKQRC